MSAAAASASPVSRLHPRSCRVAFVGPEQWLDTCAPSAAGFGLSAHRYPIEGPTRGLRESALAALAPAITVVFAPERFPVSWLRDLPGITLGVLTASADEEPADGVAAAVGALDRVLGFRPDLSGREIGGTRVWRAIPPPVADRWFSEVVPVHGRPAAMTLGRSTPHREAMLLAVKHHHDLLQVVHGVGGATLAELLSEHPVAVYAPALDTGGFGPQVGIHLAAGQLLLAEGLRPLHGLEPGLDFVAVRSPEEIVHRLDRLARFPEMYERVRIRGRMKAESFRASRVFARVATDLRRDVATFGSLRD